MQWRRSDRLHGVPRGGPKDPRRRVPCRVPRHSLCGLGKQLRALRRGLRDVHRRRGYRLPQLLRCDASPRRWRVRMLERIPRHSGRMHADQRVRRRYEQLPIRLGLLHRPRRLVQLRMSIRVHGRRRHLPRHRRVRERRGPVLRVRVVHQPHRRRRLSRILVRVHDLGLRRRRLLLWRSGRVLDAGGDGDDATEQLPRERRLHQQRSQLQLRLFVGLRGRWRERLRRH